MWRRGRRLLFMLFAWNGLLIVHIGLQLLGYRRLVRVLARLAPTPERQTYDPRARRTARLVQRAAIKRPKPPSKCLTRSILLWWFLRWMNIASVVRTGVRRNAAGTLDFHAWVEQGGVVINDQPDHVAGFEPLWSALLPENILEKNVR